MGKPVSVYMTDTMQEQVKELRKEIFKRTGIEPSLSTVLSLAIENFHERYAGIKKKTTTHKKKKKKK